MKTIKRSMAVAACAAGGIAALGAGAGASLSPAAAPAATKYTFTTLDNPADPTFNQLLGINNHNVIAGYFGDGTNNPNKGYTLAPPYGPGHYTNENFPGSAQTQVVAINDKRDTAGFWADAKGDNFGFVNWNGVFTSVSDPNIPSTVKTKVTQVLGLNNSGIAVGFYLGGAGRSNSFEYNQATRVFIPVMVHGATGVTATGINNKDDVVGFYGDSAKATHGFLLQGTTLTSFDYPGSTNTQPFGINDQNEIVGSYVDSAGATHGFTLKQPVMNAKFATVDDPQGKGNTVINGVNNAGDLVGFYLDSAKHTDGFLAQPK